MDNCGPQPLGQARRRVTMGDVDAASILYFAAPYRWLEELFTGWLKSIGHPTGSMLRAGCGCPCLASSASYLAPLVLDDEIMLMLRPSSIGRTSFAVTATVRRVSDGRDAVIATSRHVWAAFDTENAVPELRPAALPSWLRDGLAAAPLIPPAGASASVSIDVPEASHE